MNDLFAKAEEVVSRFFKDRVDAPERGTIEIHGERYILVRAASLSVEFFDLVLALYGEDRRQEAEDFARSILFDLAHAVGKSDARNFHTRMKLKDPIARMSAGPVHFAHAGWAFVDISEESRPTPDEDFYLIFDHPYSFESDAWVGTGRQSAFPVCVMNAGYSSGWCEESFGPKLVSSEILCKGKGDDVCRFIMASPERIAARIDAWIAANPELASRAAGYTIPDFFAKKREEEALKKRQDELEKELRQTQKMEALGRLAGGIAHDFNNIITVVLGQAMLVDRRLAPDDPLRRDMARIVKAGERAASLTQQLLAFGRWQVARHEILDLNTVVEEMARMIERVIGDDVELTLSLALDAGSVRADRTQLEQVLMNLSVNARDAMPKGGRLAISTARKGESVELVVADAGVGMDEDTRTRAFEPFFTTKGEQGTGLGLSTVYGIVSSSGGTISVDSAPLKGTTFRISLPRLGDKAPPRGRTDAAAVAKGNGVVLVVEDRQDLRELIGQTLETYGYQTILAGDPEDAHSVLADTRQVIDALLTDVVMPRTSGVELAAKARALRPGLAVLFMSGYAPDPKHRELFGAESATFLQKPFSPDELAAKLGNLLRR